MVGSSHQEEAIVLNTKHPSHTDPIRPVVLGGVVLFFAIFLVLRFAFLGISPVLPALVAAVVSIAVSAMAGKIVMRRLREKQEAELHAKRAEHERRTRAAIAEMRMAEAAKNERSN